MLDKEVFKKGVKDLDNYYLSWGLDLTNKAVLKAWYNMFKDFSNERFEKGIVYHAKNEHYPPSIASLVRACEAATIKKKYTKGKPVRNDKND